LNSLYPFRFQKIKNKKIPDDKKERGKNWDIPCSISSIKSFSCRIPTAQKTNAKRMHNSHAKNIGFKVKVDAF